MVNQERVKKIREDLEQKDQKNILGLIGIAMKESHVGRNEILDILAKMIEEEERMVEKAILQFRPC